VKVLLYKRARVSSLQEEEGLRRAKGRGRGKRKREGREELEKKENEEEPTLVSFRPIVSLHLSLFLPSYR
jgi:hypothetical protein